MLPKPKIHSIKVAGIKCTNCAGKIKTGLQLLLQAEQSKISVNVMQETVTVSTRSHKDLIPSVIQKLENLGYPAVNEPVLLQGGAQNQRHLTIKVAQNSQTEKIEAILRQKLMGLTSINRSHENQNLKFKLSYNSDIIKGRQIADFFQTYDPSFTITNHRVESFKTGPKMENQQNSLIKTSGLCAFFLIFNMILPFTGKWYQHMILFPHQLSIFSFSVVLNLVLSGYVFQKYTLPIVKRAYKNYKQFRSTDMQTLVALGCLSAFALCLLFFIKYGMQLVQQGKVQNPSMAIMDINDSLTSASIIVLVVNIGKYLEHKVKMRIETMTASIFPESTLFSNMKVENIQLRNRKLMIKGRKFYDTTVLEKGDVICLNSLENQRLLVDVILINGQIRAQQSTTTGNDEIMEFKKGDRIQSGALIFPLENKSDNQQCLASIQNVFQKSMLVQIGTQIKFSQNQSDDKAEGIQAVCKSIANVFVKGVITLSLLTILIWTLLIEFSYVHLDQSCSICWVFQRGIGVLVASCPCALGLAVPSVIAIVLNIATKSGILIKNNGIFEKMKLTKKISFDKTGTLFTRINKIQQYHLFAESKEQPSLWQIVALIQKQIRHPLAQVLYKQAFSKCKIQGTNYNYQLMSLPVVEKQGLTADLRNKLTGQMQKVLIGNKGILIKNSLKIPEYQIETSAGTELFLVVDDNVKLVMRLNTHSNLRPQAVQVIKKIMDQGEEVHILSGDSKESVMNLAALLNIPQRMLHPEHSSFKKMQWIKATQESGKQGVMMIGDGLNDIPCLQQSAIGVSINAKSELNINAADVVVLEENLYKILALIRLLKKGNLFININLFWAFAYNIIVMPIVAGMFYKWDIWVSPIWSSIAMSSSSIIVVSISHLLSFFTFDESLRKQSKRPFSQKKIVLLDTSNSAKSVVRERKSNYLQLMQSN